MAKLYVGNLSYDARDSDLHAAFAEHGAVAGASVTVESYSKQSRGYGFVEMPDSDEARSAVESLNGRDLHGQAIVVRVVIP